MELFIRIKDGVPFEHPIMGDNFRQAFPNVDTANLPPEFAKFVRKPMPPIGALEILEAVTYQWKDGVVEDVYQVRPMTEEERTIALQQITTRVLADVAISKQLAQSKIDSTTGAAQQVWVDYLAELNAWALVDPLQPNIPSEPVTAADGTVSSTGSSGTVPNVIG